MGDKATTENGLNNFDEDKKIFNLISDYIIVIEKTGNIIWYNSTLDNLLLTAKINVINELIHKDDEEQFNAFLTNGHSLSARIIYNNNVHWIFWKKQTKYYNNKEQLVLVGKKENMLREDNVYFNELAKEALFGYCEYALDEKMIFLNPTICNILELDANTKQIHLEDYIKMVHPIDNMSFINWLNFSNKSDQLLSTEYRIIDANDKIKHLKAFVKNSDVAGTHKKRRSVFIHDISHLKKTINHLKYSELQFRSIFTEAPIGIIYVGLNGEIIDVNDSALKILGSPSKEETLKINILEFPLLKEFGVSQKVSECIETNKSIKFTSQYKSKWGKLSELQFLISPLNDNNSINGVLIIGEDITQQTNIKNKLSESENRYLKTLQLIPDTILLFDNEFNIIDYHKSADEDCKLFTKSIIGGNIESTTSSDVFNIIKVKTKWVITNNKPVNFKFKATIGKEQLAFEARISKIDGNSFMAIIKEITEHTRTKQQLAEKELKLEEASKIAKIGWYEVIGTEGFYYGSWQAHNIFFDEFVGNPIENDNLLNAIHPDDAKHFFNTVSSNIEKKSKDFTWEYRVISPKKGIKHLWTKTYLEFDDDGNLSGRFGVVQDISELKRVQIALQRSQERLLDSQKSANIGWYEFNTITNTYTASPEAYQIYFNSPEVFECAPEKVLDVIHPDDRSFFLENQNENNKNGSNEYSFIHRIIGKNKYYKYAFVKVHSDFDESGKCVRRSGIVQDITNQIQAENALKDTEARFKGVFMNSPIGIIIFNKNGDYMLCNNIIKDTFKITNEQRLKKINLFKNAKISNKFVQKLKKGETIKFEGLPSQSFLNNIVQNNQDIVSKLHFEYRITPLENQVESTGYIALISDITQHKNMETELIEAKNKAEDADDLKSAFLANMSHEIRTPLNAILGFSSLLEYDNYTKEEHKEFIKTINNNGQYLLNIINDIIDFSKIEANQLIINYSKSNINTLIDELYALMQNLIPTGVEFRYTKQLSDEEAIINTDSKRLQQVFINLISNSSKFTEKGHIEYGYTSNESEDFITFYVTDTGCGIEKDKINEVFSRFLQLDYIKQGAGLGLSISRGIVNLLEGEIWLTSEINKGTTFYFKIPKKNKA